MQHLENEDAILDRNQSVKIYINAEVLRREEWTSG